VASRVFRGFFNFLLDAAILKSAKSEPFDADRVLMEILGPGVLEGADRLLGRRGGGRARAERLKWALKEVRKVQDESICPECKKMLENPLRELEDVAEKIPRYEEIKERLESEAVEGARRLCSQVLNLRGARFLEGVESVKKNIILKDRTIEGPQPEDIRRVEETLSRLSSRKVKVSYERGRGVLGFEVG